MYKIKQIPQDFIVKEISNVKIQNNGRYAYYILEKIRCSTVGALQILSKKFRIPLKHFGFAGNKDKNAVTVQKISIFNGSKNFENCKFDKIKLRYLGNGKEPISLGDLEGNEFNIAIRSLESHEAASLSLLKSKKPKTKKIRIANFFGPQRFSRNNHLVGKAVIKKDFRKAVELLLENKGVAEDIIRNYLAKNKNNYVGAIRTIPLKIRKLFVHSYQSFLFNKIANAYLKNSKGIISNIKVPIIGFNFELNSIRNKRLKSAIKKAIDGEGINARDFIIHQMPELTSEGTARDLFFQFEDLSISEIEEDELDNDKKKLKVNFFLPKGCYATVAVEGLISKQSNKKY